MINGLLEFREERDEARMRLRTEIFRQTLDQSSRGRSVWRSFLAMGDQALHTSVGTPRSAKERWRDAYRDTRKRDREICKSISSITSQWMSTYVKCIVAPRKIDSLLGRPSGF